MLKNLKNLQGFLGFGNFNRQFISKYLFIILPLTELIKKNVLFVWSTFCQKIFDKLKEIFTMIFCFILFTSDRPIRIEIDASNKNIRVYFLQQNDKEI